MKSFSQFLSESLAAAQRLIYRDFKGRPGEKNFQFTGDPLRRADSKLKHWVVYSLGASFHDPQAMWKLASGPKVPDGVQQVSTALELRKAWKEIQDAEARAYAFSN